MTKRAKKTHMDHLLASFAAIETAYKEMFDASSNWPMADHLNRSVAYTFADELGRMVTAARKHRDRITQI
jgi:hypothetical protein